ncbi:Hypothetical protein PHPALM_16812 [Phytophthora palmivora]|uniref:Uncharacterized protein n=1 Tax=Phytophthora palmivora TaxID=4796 RepID=A0A2P4XNU5_9STRA|nr:Hypothetical protein PHPALM_16812 [Phytophthora palmivora]
MTGGLRQLTVPTRNQANRFQGIVAYADVHCPEMWRTFNTTCTQLGDFHWLVIPFADPLFHVFGEHRSKSTVVTTTDHKGTTSPRLAVYGDEFWEAVAEYCPLLRSIEMKTARTTRISIISLFVVSKIERSICDECMLGVRLGGHQRTRLGPLSVLLSEATSLLNEFIICIEGITKLERALHA